MPCHSSWSRDQALVQIVDAALADATRRSGKWLKCRPGCSRCCVGVFAINQLDARRLREGLSELELKDGERAARILERAHQTVARLSAEFPGDPSTGVLDESQESAQRWNDFANDQVCPALDPQTGVCELYDFRPIACRTFGPPVMSEGDLEICELCFDGATEQDIGAAEMHLDFSNLEAALLKDIEITSARRGETIVAFALVR